MRPDFFTPKTDKVDLFGLNHGSHFMQRVFFHTPDLKPE
jgi:hypothetical protein